MSIVKKYQATITSIVSLTEGIYSVEFVPVSGIFKFKSGQFLHLAIDEFDPSCAWPESRCFSIQTAPNSEKIKITYAVKGRFTKRMETELNIGQQVWLKLPYGDLFTQEHARTNTVFIAGGTGITPFLSLFTSSDFAAYKNPKLYAGFRSKKFNFYQEELDDAGVINPNLQTTVFLQDSDGVIDIAQILHESDRNTSFFISGPPEMIGCFKQYLMENGIDNVQVKTDDWE